MRSVRFLACVLFLLGLSSYAAAQVAPIITNVPPANDATGAGAEYVRTLTLSQGTPPVTWDFDSPPVNPPGAQIDQNGHITGWTPTVNDIGFTFNFHVRATNSTGGNFVTWSVKVGPFNNGFNAQHIFAIHNDPFHVNPATGLVEPSFGKVLEYDELGNPIRDYTNFERWVSLSFSGTGTPAGTNDAWCYTLRGWKGASDNANWFVPPFDGVNIRQFRSDGNVQNQNWIHLLGDPKWLPATDLVPGSIRYSSFHNSVFMGIDRNQTASDPALIYELSLDLTQIKNVYTGPNTNTGGQVNLDINSRDGTLYMVNQKLGNDNGAGTNLGDLVAFNTAGGSTSSFTTLVNGQTFAVDGQPNHSNWSLPNCVIYRPGASAAADTLVVLIDQTSVAMEFWANTSSHPVDGNGNLQLKGIFTGPIRGWNGQFASFDNTIHYGAMSDGFGAIQFNNVLNKFLAGDPNWIDADSPSYPLTILVPIISQLPPDPDQTVAQFEYIRQLSTTQGAPVTWSLLQAPTGAQIDQTGKISGWKPSAGFAGNSVQFQVQASNALASGTASWVVHVLSTRDATNNGFPINDIYAIKNYENPLNLSYPMMGKIQVYEEDTGNIVNNGFTNIEGWVSLTFTGTGTNDTRCFAVRRWNSSNPGGNGHYQPPYDTFNIREFNSIGEVPNGNAITPSVGGTNVFVGNIRYSSFHNDLFVGFDRDETAVNKATVFQYHLNLQFVAAYNGPFTQPGGAVNVDINARTGMLYMVNQRLGNDNGTGGPLGDLVGFQNGFTNSFSTLINGQTFSLSHPEWYLPNTVIFRQGTAATDDTLVVFTDGNGSNPPPVTMEFWADTTSHPLDVNGNLQFKGFIPGPSRGWNGQQDSFTRDIDFGAMADGFGLITTANALHAFLPTDPDWADAASPRYPFVPGLCNGLFADADKDGDVDMDDFGVFQRCYTGSFSPIPSSPETCLCFDRSGNSVGSPPDNHIDQFDLAKFTQCFSGTGVAFTPGCGSN